MSLLRFFNPKNYYSNTIEVLMKRNCDKKNGWIKAPNHDFSIVTEKNISDSQLFENHKYIDIYKSMLERGDIGIYGYVDGKCACRVWAVVDPSNFCEGGVSLGLSTDDVFVHYLLTDVAYRGQGLASECLMFINDLFSDRDIYSTIEIHNNPSFSAFRKAGYRDNKVLILKKRLLRSKMFVHTIK